MDAAADMNVVLVERLIPWRGTFQRNARVQKFPSALMNQQRRRDEYYSPAQWLMKAVFSADHHRKRKDPLKDHAESFVGAIMTPAGCTLHFASIRTAGGWISDPARSCVLLPSDTRRREFLVWS